MDVITYPWWNVLAYIFHISTPLLVGRGPHLRTAILPTFCMGWGAAEWTTSFSVVFDKYSLFSLSYFYSKQPTESSRL